MYSRRVQCAVAVLVITAASLVLAGALDPTRQRLLWAVAFILAFGAAFLIALKALKMLAIINDHIATPSLTLQRIAAELHSMQVILNRFPACSLPTSSWSMRFSNLHVLLELLDETKPRTIVEFGSGLSTVMVANWLRAHGNGHLYTFDHDRSWANQTCRCLCRNSLDVYVTMHVCPLVPTETCGVHTTWYSAGKYLEPLQNVDFVIVDGPPGGRAKRLSRLGAIDALKGALSRTCVIVLDDAHRAGEQEVLNMWTKQNPQFSLSIYGESTGLAVLVRRDFDDVIACSPPTTVMQVSE